MIVGDGPAIGRGSSGDFPAAEFLGYRRGEALAEAYASADLFVFPSRTDTFGLAMIEALACGVPVAAYPVAGPIDIVTAPVVGALDDDLGKAIDRALRDGDPAACVRHARTFTWDACTDQLLSNFVPIRGRLPTAYR